MIGHDDLDAFVDGELAADDAAAFRSHLASCARCAGALRGRMLEAAVLDDARDQLAARRAPRRRVAWKAAVAAVALAAAVALYATRRPAPPPATPAIALAAERAVAVRFTAPAFDHYRPLHVDRAAGPPRHEAVALATLATLPPDALVAAQALDGDLAAARRALATRTRGAAELADDAALVLLETDVTVPAATDQAAAEHALSLAAAALRADPACTQARWNEAVALERLHLPLAAADVYDEVAARGEPGWADEARATAARLRASYRATLDAARARQAEVDAMAGGGPIVATARALEAPDVAREGLYRAIAATASPARLDALAPLATALDGALGTTSLADLIERVRAAKLDQRAPIAAVFAALLADGKRTTAQVHAVRDRAEKAGELDIAAAAATLVGDNDSDDADRALLVKVGAHATDPWWQLVAIDRQAFDKLYDRHDFAAADLLTRQAEPICRAHPIAGWCGQLEWLGAHASSRVGHTERAYDLITASRATARAAGDLEAEAAALDIAAQIASERIDSQVDPVVLVDADMHESAARFGGCMSNRRRFEYAANAALDHHRYAEAEQLVARADAVTGCADKASWFGNEEARARVLARRATAADLAAFEARLDGILRAATPLPDLHPLFDGLVARVSLSIDRAGAEATLRRLLAAPKAERVEDNTALLLEALASDGKPDQAIAALAAQLHVDVGDHCVVGIGDADRVTVVVRGRDGSTASELRDVPEGQRVLAAEHVVSPALRARLAGCARIDVLALGPYLGLPRVLDASLPWAYRSARPPGPAPAPHRGLVVTDVAPPDELHLPPLHAIASPPDAVTLRGAAATPSAVLAAMTSADPIVIDAHGVTDASDPNAASLALSPDARGDYALTAEMIAGAKLDASPVVLLAACDAARVQTSKAPWSLATSLLAVGARAVIAPTTAIDDANADDVFAHVLARIARGEEPAAALAAERSARATSVPWLLDIVLFE